MCTQTASQVKFRPDCARHLDRNVTAADLFARDDDPARCPCVSRMTSAQRRRGLSVHDFFLIVSVFFSKLGMTICMQLSHLCRCQASGSIASDLEPAHRHTTCHVKCSRLSPHRRVVQEAASKRPRMRRLSIYNLARTHARLSNYSRGGYHHTIRQHSRASKAWHTLKSEVSQAQRGCGRVASAQRGVAVGHQPSSSLTQRWTGSGVCSCELHLTRCVSCVVQRLFGAPSGRVGIGCTTGFFYFTRF